MQLMGLQEMKGKSKATGKAYDAVLLFVQSEDDRIIGVKTDDVWVPRDMWDDMVGEEPSKALLGHEVTASFNKRGFLQDIKIQ